MHVPGGRDGAQPALRADGAAVRPDQRDDRDHRWADRQIVRAGAARQYVWPGAATRNIRISAKLTGGSDFEFENRDGLWSLFRFFPMPTAIVPRAAEVCWSGWCGKAGKGAR